MLVSKIHFADKLLLFLLILSSTLSVITFHIDGIWVTITPFRISFLIVSITSIYFFRKKSVLTVNKITLEACCLISFLFVIYLCALSRKHSIYAHQANFRFLEIILFFSTILLMNSLLKNKNIFFKCLKYIVYTSLIISFFGYIDLFLKISMHINMWNYISDYEDPFSLFLNKDYNFFIQQRMTGTFFDSNLFSYYLLFPLTITVYYGLDRQVVYRIFSTKTSIIISCIISITIILTLSRSGIFLMVFIWAISFYKFNVKLKNFLFLAIIFIPFLISINYYVSNITGISVTGAIARRFHPEESSFFEKENMRAIRMKAGIDAINSNWFFGVGLGNLGRFLPSGIRKSDEITSHSFYIDILSDVGALGFFVYVLFLFLLVLNISKKRVLEASNLNIMFILFLAFLMMSQIFYSNLLSPVFAINFGLFLAFIKLFPNKKMKHHKCAPKQSFAIS